MVSSRTETFLAIIVGSYVITKIKTEAFLVRSGVQLNQLPLPPNQSLKLTEPAVDDFAARCWTDLALLIGTSAQQPTLRRLFAAAA